MDWTPHATVAAIVEKDGRFLFVEEMAEGQRVFNQPAGHIEQGESFVAATCRETLEETRWRVKPLYLVGIYVYTAPANQVTYHRYCYACEALCEEPEASLDEGILAAHWLTRDELISRQGQWRSPLVLKCLDDYLAGKRYPLELIYEA